MDGGGEGGAQGHGMPLPRRCSFCSQNGHNSRTCPERREPSVKLFGVRLSDRAIRKSSSTGNLRHYDGRGEPKEAASVSGSEAERSENGGAQEGYQSDSGNQGGEGTGKKKKGKAWSEEEHRCFLVGLNKLGKGDWRGISRNYVQSRTPTQVASHAQKYFIRQNNLTRRRRRSSLFDMGTEAQDGLSLQLSLGRSFSTPSLPALSDAGQRLRTSPGDPSGELSSPTVAPRASGLDLSKAPAFLGANQSLPPAGNSRPSLPPHPPLFGTGDMSEAGPGPQLSASEFRVPFAAAGAAEAASTLPAQARPGDGGAATGVEMAIRGGRYDGPELVPQGFSMGARPVGMEPWGSGARPTVLPELSGQGHSAPPSSAGGYAAAPSQAASALSSPPPAGADHGRAMLGPMDVAALRTGHEAATRGQGDGVEGSSQQQQQQQWCAMEMDGHAWREGPKEQRWEARGHEHLGGGLTLGLGLGPGRPAHPPASSARFPGGAWERPDPRWAPPGAHVRAFDRLHPVEEHEATPSASPTHASFALGLGLSPYQPRPHVGEAAPPAAPPPSLLWAPDTRRPADRRSFLSAPPVTEAFGPHPPELLPPQRLQTLNLLDAADERPAQELLTAGRMESGGS